MAESIRVVEHPILGFISISGETGRGISSLSFLTARPAELVSQDPLLLHVEELLQRYLLGEPVDFSVLPLSPEGTPFQQEVWRVLKTIRMGETRSYKWVAQQLGKPTASRAIGQANGKNPIAILIPCHRVVQESGDLGGYSGGLHIKSFLLSLEQQRNSIQEKLNLGDALHPTSMRGMTLL